MPRLLVMSERTVTEGARSAYVQTLAVRCDRAATAGANFWVFEQLDRRGRFLEFVEAASTEALASAITAVAETAADELRRPVVWREWGGLNQDVGPL